MDMTYGITSEVKWSLLQCTYNVLLSIFSPPPPPKKRSHTRGFGSGRTRGFNSEPSSSFKSRNRGIDDLPGIKHLSITKRLAVVWTPKWFPSFWNTLRCSGSSLDGQLYLRLPLQNRAFVNSQSNSDFYNPVSGGSSCEHLSHVPRVSAHKSFHCHMFENRICVKTGLVVYGKVCIQDL